MNDEADSSDSENENGISEASDDDDELSFESDDEGNYRANFNKLSMAHHSDDDEDGDDQEESNASEDEELSDAEEVSGEESDARDGDDDDDPESAYISDDSEQLSFEEDESDGEHAPSVSVQKGKAKKRPTLAETTKQNGKPNSVQKPQKSSEPGSLLRIKKPPTNAAEAFKSELKKSGSSSGGGGGEQASTTENDEYEKFDTDDEEDIRNTVGNIPMKWYDEYKHIGYDWDAKKIIKPPKRDQLDDFLKRMEDPNFWRTVKDPQTGQDVILSDADIELIKRINSQRVPNADFDEYAVRFLT